VRGPPCARMTIGWLLARNGASTDSNATTAIHTAPNFAPDCPNVSCSACPSSERRNTGSLTSAGIGAGAGISEGLGPIGSLAITHPRISDYVKDVRQQISPDLKQQN